MKRKEWALCRESLVATLTPAVAMSSEGTARWLLTIICFTGPPPKSSKYRKVDLIGVSRTIYVNVDSPNPGFPYFNFSRKGPV